VVNDEEMVVTDRSVDYLPAGVLCERYTALRERALDHRKRGSGDTPGSPVQILLRFWAHYLVRNFNAAMYEEFRDMARGDAEAGKSLAGLSALMDYYTAVLQPSSLQQDHHLPLSPPATGARAMGDDEPDVVARDVVALSRLPKRSCSKALSDAATTALQLVRSALEGGVPAMHRAVDDNFRRRLQAERGG